jgi:hypothetical protein
MSGEKCGDHVYDVQNWGRVCCGIAPLAFTAGHRLHDIGSL